MLGGLRMIRIIAVVIVDSHLSTIMVHGMTSLTMNPLERSSCGHVNRGS